MSEGIGTIQGVLENYKHAVNERDNDKFLNAYSSDVHIYDCWGSWECKGKNAWSENVFNWFNGLREDGDVLKVEIDEVVIEESTSLAFVHCSVTFAAYKEGSDEKLRQMTNRFTFGLKRVNGSWLITHEHSSLPINMEDGKGMFHLR
ncbi:YybH family protein [Rossellomorea sp. NS-SX7]|uniref:YybH family protein n=1 Tax=Rossellomorea sp. NS-SX7 TaxID=3463856 RepID=UPI00405909FF